MPAKTIKVDSAAEAYLTVLKDRDVDYLFGNAGTDFPSIIEGLSKSLTGEGSAPTPITVPHENLGVAMAHGYYIATGRMAAVACWALVLRLSCSDAPTACANWV